MTKQDALPTINDMQIRMPLTEWVDSTRCIRQVPGNFLDQLFCAVDDHFVVRGSVPVRQSTIVRMANFAYCVSKINTLSSFLRIARSLGTAPDADSHARHPLWSDYRAMYQTVLGPVCNFEFSFKSARTFFRYLDCLNASAPNSLACNDSPDNPSSIACTEKPR